MICPVGGEEVSPAVFTAITLEFPDLSFAAVLTTVSQGTSVDRLNVTMEGLLSLTLIV
jgi:hypothetical protein